jgi:hypothetical protein
MTATYKIAEEIKDELNGETFSQSFTAIRSYLPTSDQEDLEDWRVTVVPVKYEETNQSRTSSQVEHVVHVGIQKNINYTDNTSMDAAADLAIEIIAFLRRIALTTNPNIITRSINMVVIADPEDMRRQSFTTAVEIMFLEKL